jgi:hypothetical protein
MGFFGRGCLYIQVGGGYTSLGEASRGCQDPGLSRHSTIRFWLREGRQSFLRKVRIVQVYRYSVRILIRFLFVVSSSGGTASK